jgi:hypothetical protein
MNNTSFTFVAAESIAHRIFSIPGHNISSHNQTIAGQIDAMRQLIQVPACFSRQIGFTADISKHRSK